MGRGIQPRPSYFSHPGRIRIQSVRVLGSVGRHGFCRVRLRFCSGHWRAQCFYERKQYAQPQRHGRATLRGRYFAHAFAADASGPNTDAYGSGAYRADTHGANPNRRKAIRTHAAAGQSSERTGSESPRSGPATAGPSGTGRICPSSSCPACKPYPRSAQKNRSSGEGKGFKKPQG